MSRRKICSHMKYTSKMILLHCRTFDGSGIQSKSEPPKVSNHFNKRYNREMFSSSIRHTALDRSGRKSRGISPITPIRTRTMTPTSKTWRSKNPLPSASVRGCAAQRSAVAAAEQGGGPRSSRRRHGNLPAVKASHLSSCHHPPLVVALSDLA